MLRPWINSDKVNSLSVHSERFFTRLIMVVDDYGCFYADTRLLKANLFPLLLDAVREADMIRWLAECQKAGLIVLYESSGKKYLQIVDFRQRLDKAKSKFPLPVDGIPETVNDFPAEVEVEKEVEKKLNRAFAPPTKEDVSNYFLKKLDEFTAMGEAEKFVNYYESNGWMVGKNKMKNWNAAAENWIKNISKFNKNGSHQPTPRKGNRNDEGAEQLLDSLKPDLEGTGPGDY